jgi:hypothetical protein
MTPRAWATLLVLATPFLLAAALWDAIGPGDWSKAFFYVCGVVLLVLLAVSLRHDDSPHG